MAYKRKIKDDEDLGEDLKNIKMKDVYIRKSRNGNSFNSEMMNILYSKFDRDSVGTFGTCLIDDVAVTNTAHRTKAGQVTSSQLACLYKEWLDQKRRTWGDLLSAMKDNILNDTLATFVAELRQDMKDADIREDDVIDIHGDLYDKIVDKIPICNTDGVLNLGFALGLEEVKVKRICENTTSGERKNPSDVAKELVIMWHKSHPEGTMYSLYEGMRKAQMPSKVMAEFANFWREEDGNFKKQIKKKKVPTATLR